MKYRFNIGGYRDQRNARVARLRAEGQLRKEKERLEREEDLARIQARINKEFESCIARNFYYGFKPYHHKGLTYYLVATVDLLVAYNYNRIKIVIYVCGDGINSPGYLDAEGGLEDCYIESIEIKGTYQRQGFGSMCLDYLEEICTEKGVNKISGSIFMKDYDRRKDLYNFYNRKGFIIKTLVTRNSNGYFEKYK